MPRSPSRKFVNLFVSSTSMGRIIISLEQSCHDELKKKVLENTMNVPDLEKGGPLFFKVMMDVIPSNIDKAIRTLTLMLPTFKITSIQGENISSIQGEYISKAVSQLQGAYRHLEISEKVPHDISDHLINVFRKTSVNEFNSTFKTMKDNICIENWKYYPENILRIDELTYTEMIENGLCTGASTIQESGFVVNTTCWNCRGKGHRASNCPSKKIGGTPASGVNSVSHQGDNPRGTRNVEPDTKEIFGKPHKYNITTKCWTNRPKRLWEWHRWRK